MNTVAVPSSMSNARAAALRTRRTQPSVGLQVKLQVKVRTTGPLPRITMSPGEIGVLLSSYQGYDSTNESGWLVDFGSNCIVRVPNHQFNRFLKPLEVQHETA